MAKHIQHSEYFWIVYGKNRDKGHTDEYAREVAAIVEERHRVKIQREQRARRPYMPAELPDRW